MGIKEKWKKTRPITLTLNEIERELKALAKQDKKILIIYLFGSRVKEEAKPDSDIDIAIFTTPDYTTEDYLEFVGKIQDVLRSDRFDLVWLNRANPVIKFYTIKEGKVIFYSDEDVLNDFELKSKKEFWDYKLYLSKREKYGL
jgi:hypothetical protein